MLHEPQAIAVHLGSVGIAEAVRHPAGAGSRAASCTVSSRNRALQSAGQVLERIACVLKGNMMQAGTQQNVRGFRDKGTLKLPKSTRKRRAQHTESLQHRLQEVHCATNKHNASWFACAQVVQGLHVQVCLGAAGNAGRWSSPITCWFRLVLAREEAWSNSLRAWRSCSS